MPRGDNPHLDGEPDGGPATQREILAQFEDAIAGMRTREIQIGLRQLLAGGVRPPRALRSREADSPRGDQGRVGQGRVGQGRVDQARGARGSSPGGERAGVPAPVAELVRAVKTPSARRQMQRLAGDAQLERQIQIDTGTAGRMVWPYRWLLDRAGDEGLRLTEAGHLPPAEVAVATRELNVAAPGPGARENQVPRVRQLRESAQAMGLLRKERGQLLLTVRGAELRSRPAALWWHLAERMPLRSAASCEAQPGLILLVCVAARCTDTLSGTVARMLSAIGWTNSDSGPLTGADAARATAGTHAMLQWLGALPSEPPPSETLPSETLPFETPPFEGGAPWPAPEGVAFARAALRTWPA